MEILVTGGAGFLGARLIAALLVARDKGRAGLPDFDREVSLDLGPCPVDDPRSVRDRRHHRPRLVGPKTGAVFHLAAVVSTQAEAEFETGMTVNLDGTRYLLEACRTQLFPQS